MAPSFSVPRRRRTRLLLTSARLPSAGILAQRGRLEWDAEGTALEVLNFELIERCRHGESAAWTAFLPCFQEIGRRALRYFRLSATDCDDLLADVLTELYGGGLRKFRGNTVGELVNFVKRAVRNRALDRFEEARRIVGLGDVAELGEPETPPDVANAECLEFLREEIQQLSRAERELYLMRARGLK